jgi:hypothetical protein
MGKIQEIYPEHFHNYKVRYTQTKVEDLVNQTQQEEKVISEHKRAHRNARKSRIQLLEKYLGF